VEKTVSPRCGQCQDKLCRNGKDCFSQADGHLQFYQDNDIAKLHRAASEIEAKHYCQETRLGEIILFANQLNCRNVGLAFCIGLSEEAGIINEILLKHFDVISVCCKVCGLEKKDRDLERISSNQHEVMCNPAGQADLLNKAGTELNILCGLCVGHDAIFAKLSQAPVTTLIAKDRVLAHNPVGAIYCRYVLKHFDKTNSIDQKRVI